MIELGLEPDRPLALHRFDGVVDRVDDDTLQLLGIEADQMHLWIVAALESDAGKQAFVERQRFIEERVQRRRLCPWCASAQTARTRPRAP